MTAIANVFLKLQTVKNLVTALCKNGRFGTPLESEQAKVSRIIATSPEQHFYRVFS